MKITSVNLVPGFSWGGRVAQYSVQTTTEDGKQETLFSYYTDEHNYTANQFIGLTNEQACQLHHKNDVAYLRS